MRKRREKVEISGDEEQLVSFRLGKGTFAVRVSQVREIGKVQDITRIPKMPDYVEGVMNLRIVVDSVEDVMRVPRASISPPPKTLSAGVDTSFLTGICKMPDKLIMLLGLENVFNDQAEREKLMGLKDEIAKGELA
jgi:purine-binding chemotaxis protein CheW